MSSGKTKKTWQHLVDLRKRAGLSQRDLGSLIGVSGEMIRLYEHGSIPGADKLAALADALNVKSSDLTKSLPGQSGEAQGDGDDAPPPEPPRALQYLSDTRLWRAGYVRIPDAGVEPGAGPPREAFAEGFEGDGASGEIVPIEWASLRYGVAPELLRGRRVQTITVRGDSMRPTIRPGERARIFILDGEPVQDGAVYVIGTPDGTVIKRIRFTSIETEDGRDVKRYVSIISDNKRAESFRVPHAVFERDYRCIAVLLEVLRPI